MKLRRVIIKNFRSLVDIDVPISDKTVLIGENNSGKSAFLDALRLAIVRGSTRNNPFSEYDYFLENPGDSPESSPGIEIETWFVEDMADEWPIPLTQDLDDIIQTDTSRNLDYIGLRITSRYDAGSQAINFKTEFLNLHRQPLTGRGSNPSLISRFANYIRFFYLPSLRDPDSQFSPRSSLWGNILRDMKISQSTRDAISKRLERINRELLSEDPRLDDVVNRLDQVQKILTPNSSQSTSIRALPANPWDLMSKSELVIKSRGSKIHLPLSSHGQGVQSLSILFLFQAFIEILMKPSFQAETEAILGIEEPEAHLHPHAVRSLSANIDEIPSPKIITTHSPYFIQEIPIKDLRLFRKKSRKTEVYYVKRNFSLELPSEQGLTRFCQSTDGKYEYYTLPDNTAKLVVNGKVTEEEKRRLLQLFPGRPELHQAIVQLFKESQVYITDSEIVDLEIFTKRTRGELFFARSWLLCEGQSEYIVLKYFGTLLEQPFDNNGITVIDFQNNGSLSSFVSLARSLEMPWVMTCDDDDAGKDFAKKAGEMCATDAEKRKSVKKIPVKSADFEGYLYDSGFGADYLNILVDQSRTKSPRLHRWVISEKTENNAITRLSFLDAGTWEIAVTGQQARTIQQRDNGFGSMQRELILRKIQSDKPHYASLLVEKLIARRATPAEIPPFYQNLISSLIRMTI